MLFFSSFPILTLSFFTNRFSFEHPSWSKIEWGILYFPTKIHPWRLFQMAQKVQFVETVLRDANQSLIATRLPFEKFKPMLETIDKVGYYAIECWGGATFDVCLRYLNEDPWERLRKIKSVVKNTKLP